METKTENHTGAVWFLVIIILLFGPIWFFYGSINPCDILKKEIAVSLNHVEGGASQGYMLFGGFIDRKIDMLSPSECAVGIYQIKTKGLEESVDNLMSTSNFAPSQLNVITTEEDFSIKSQEYDATFSQDTQETSIMLQSNIIESEKSNYQNLLDETKAAREKLRQQLLEYESNNTESS